MKIKNKRTGEKGWLYANKNANYNVLDADDKVLAVYPSLAELNKDWEDYEEPKEFYFIDQFMSVSKGVVDDVEYAGKHNAVNYAKKTSNNLKTAGNYFLSREDAKKAVEKLKAWKRLRDKGFRFHDYCDIDPGEITFSLDIDVFTADRDKLRQLAHDLDLLFSGDDD